VVSGAPPALWVGVTLGLGSSGAPPVEGSDSGMEGPPPLPTGCMGCEVGGLGVVGVAGVVTPVGVLAGPELGAGVPGWSELELLPPTGVD
jgi:hypothetical protein